MNYGKVFILSKISNIIPFCSSAFLRAEHLSAIPPVHLRQNSKDQRRFDEKTQEIKKNMSLVHKQVALSPNA